MGERQAEAEEHRQDLGPLGPGRDGPMRRLHGGGAQVVGLPGKHSIAELCRRNVRAQSLDCKWSKGSARRCMLTRRDGPLAVLVATDAIVGSVSTAESE